MNSETMLLILRSKFGLWMHFMVKAVTDFTHRFSVIHWPQTILYTYFVSPFLYCLYYIKTLLISHVSSVLSFCKFSLALLITPKCVSNSTVFNLSKFKFFISDHFKFLGSWFHYLVFLFRISISCHLSVHIKKLKHMHIHAQDSFQQFRALGDCYPLRIQDGNTIPHSQASDKIIPWK